MKRQREIIVDKTSLLVPLLLNWFSQNARDLPWRKTSDPYAIWISEIMLQQTQVKAVIPYWERWMRVMPTITNLAKAKPEHVLKLWEGLGYYTRARNLQKSAKLICEKHEGHFPDNFDAVFALPGIGRYTAGAICSIAYNQPKPILDGNVIRVLTRFFGIPGNPREKKTNAALWDIAGQSVNRASTIKRPWACSHFNQSLMELGALVCTPRQPKCFECPAKELCFAYQNKRTDKFPNLAKRVEATQQRFVAFIVEKNGRFLVQQRAANVVNADLWEFPNVQFVEGRTHLKKNPFRIPAETTPICIIKHSITRYKITLEVFAATFLDEKRISAGKWLRLSQLNKLAFSGAHRKILDRLILREK